MCIICSHSDGPNSPCSVQVPCVVYSKGDSPCASICLGAPLVFDVSLQNRVHPYVSALRWFLMSPCSVPDLRQLNSPCSVPLVVRPPSVRLRLVGVPLGDDLVSLV